LGFNLQHCKRKTNKQTKKPFKLGMVDHECNFSTQEAEAASKDEAIK
jgi:hypothetical protein